MLKYYSDDVRVMRTLDGQEDVLAITANPFLANYIAFSLNERIVRDIVPRSQLR